MSKTQGLLLRQGSGHFSVLLCFTAANILSTAGGVCNRTLLFLITVCWYGRQDFTQRSRDRLPAVVTSSHAHLRRQSVSIQHTLQIGAISDSIK